MGDFARTLAVPALLGLILLAVGCAPVVSLEPIYTEKDLVFDPVALGVWYNDDEDIYVHVTQAGDKAYDLVVVGDGLGPARFEVHLVNLKGQLFVDLYPAGEYTRLGFWYWFSFRGVHHFALVKQLSPAPVVTSIDPDYFEKHAPTIRHRPLGDDDDDGILITASTKKVQRFLRKAVKRGAFDHKDGALEFTASKATALHFAAARGRFKETKQLIEKGVDIDARNEQGHTPLHWAAEFEQTETVVLLIAAGANVNAKDDDGDTPLHHAARSEAVSVVQLLLAKGANINAKDDDGDTPLHNAAWGDGTATVAMLLTKGANIDAKDDDGDTPLHNAARADGTAMVAMLLTKGANINAKDDRGNTPLHDAASRGAVSVVQLLLARGAEINATTTDGNTPLHLATAESNVLTRAFLPVDKRRRAAVAKLLLAEGADVDVKNKKDQTPLDAAKAYHPTNHEIIRLLERHSAK